MNSYADISGIDFKEALDTVSFPIEREDLLSEQSHLHSNRDAVVRKDTNQVLGIVGKKCPIILYEDIMNWLGEEFEKINVPFKLRENMITKNGDMYQEYVFDYDVPAPDDQNINAMLLVRGSYTGMPLVIEFGTYRFVCSNGVTVGDTIERMKIDGRNGVDILGTSITDQLHYKFGKFTEVAGKYSGLNDIEFDPYVFQLLQSEVLPILMKKNVMYLLQEEGSIELTVEKLKSENLTGAVEELYNIVKDETAWHLYNLMTQYVTHNVRSLNGRQAQYQAISQFFEI